MKFRKYKLNQTSVRSVFDWNKKLKSKKDGCVIKLYNKGCLIGNAIYYKNDNFVYNLVVNPKYRHLGYGRKILQEVEKNIFKNFEEVKLIPQDNDDSLRYFYSKLGYSGFDESMEGYEEEDKTWWIMIKRKNVCHK